MSLEILVGNEVLLQNMEKPKKVTRIADCSGNALVFLEGEEFPRGYDLNYMCEYSELHEWDDSDNVVTGLTDYSKLIGLNYPVTTTDNKPMGFRTIKEATWVPSYGKFAVTLSKRNPFSTLLTQEEAFKMVYKNLYQELT